MDTRAIGQLACPAILAMAAFAAFSPSTARAYDVADFYKGKQIRLVIGSKRAASDVWPARSSATWHGISRATDLPSAEHDRCRRRTAADWLYNIAPKDGSVIGTISQSAPLDRARREAASASTPRNSAGLAIPWSTIW
jgi:hypothetical protein